MSNFHTKYTVKEYESLIRTRKFWKVNRHLRAGLPVFPVSKMIVYDLEGDGGDMGFHLSYSAYKLLSNFLHYCARTKWTTLKEVSFFIVTIFPFLRVSSNFDSLDGFLTNWGRLPRSSEWLVASTKVSFVMGTKNIQLAQAMIYSGHFKTDGKAKK